MDILILYYLLNKISFFSEIDYIILYMYLKIVQENFYRALL